MEGQKDQASENENSKYILAIDDDPDIVTLVKQALRKQGFKVHAFTDPPMALEYLRGHRNYCLLALSDIRMPGMNGYEFVTHVKKINPNLKVILMTAFEIEDKEFHNVLPDIKVDGFLQKPFSTQQLNDVVQRINT